MFWPFGMSYVSFISLVAHHVCEVSLAQLELCPLLLDELVVRALLLHVVLHRQVHRLFPLHLQKQNSVMSTFTYMYWRFAEVTNNNSEIEVVMLTFAGVEVEESVASVDIEAGDCHVEGVARVTRRRRTCRFMTPLDKMPRCDIVEVLNTFKVTITSSA